MVVEEHEQRHGHPNERRSHSGQDGRHTGERRPDQRTVHAEDPVADERDHALVDGRDAGAKEHRSRDVADVLHQFPDLPVGKRHDFHQPCRAFAAFDQQVVAGERREDENEQDRDRGGDDRRRAPSQGGGQIAEQLAEATLDARRVESEAIQERDDVVAQQPGRAAVLVSLGGALQQIDDARSDDEQEEGEESDQHRHDCPRQERGGDPGMARQVPALQQAFLHGVDADGDRESQEHRYPDRLQRLPEEVGTEGEQHEESAVLEFRALDSGHAASVDRSATACAQQAAGRLRKH